MVMDGRKKIREEKKLWYNRYNKEEKNKNT